MSTENLNLELHFKQPVLKFLVEMGLGFQLIFSREKKTVTTKIMLAFD